MVVSEWGFDASYKASDELFYFLLFGLSITFFFLSVVIPVIHLFLYCSIKLPFS